MKVKLFSKFWTFFYLMICLMSLSDYQAFAQERFSVSGVVKDQLNEPIMGASIVSSKGTVKGTITDLDGNFLLENVSVGETFTVSFIGYKSYNFKIKNKEKLLIILEEDSKLLDEVVVVGYGQMKKSDLTGSVASVKAEKLADIPTSSIESVLQGRIAGVQVVNASQDPGASSTVRIRGNSSLNGSNSPLVVIDGFPYGEAGNLKHINPQDIVSMEVLKDASASAIYGSRGANGVILITTKKRKKCNVYKYTSTDNIIRVYLRAESLARSSFDGNVK